MPPQQHKSKTKSCDKCKFVVLLDSGLMATSGIGHHITQQLQLHFGQDGLVKSASDNLNMTNSVQWLVQSENGKWKRHRFVLILVHDSHFQQLLRDDPTLDGLLPSLLQSHSTTNKQRFRIIICKNESPISRKKKSGDAIEQHLLLEKKRQMNQKLLQWKAKCHALFDVEVDTSAHDLDYMTTQIIKITKGIMDSVLKDNLTQFSDSHGCQWIPKKAKLPPVAVAIKGSSQIGLFNLWQRYIMQICRTIDAERAKVIAAHPLFCTPSLCLESLKRCASQKEAEMFLSQMCPVRPSASSSLVLRGARPNIGPETSRKFWRVMATTDGMELI